MRGLFAGLLCASLLGCGVAEPAPRPVSTANAASEECPGCGQCCASPSRAALLNKSGPANVLRPAEELSKEIEAHQGKVVCLFVWGSYHLPSIKQLPALAELNKKFTQDKVVVLTACHAPPETREMARNILDRSNVRFTSFVAEEDVPVAGERIWRDLGLPAMLVFSRDGKITGRFQASMNSPGFDLKAIEAAVTTALQNK